MPLIMTATGLDSLIQRLQSANAAIRLATQTALQEHATATAEQLSAAAPKGPEGGMPLAGDTSGHLADSFEVASPEAGTVQVKTTQPAKLGLLLSGTGIYGPHSARIRPLVKRALYWQGARNPVRSVAGMRPNHFIYPILDEARMSVSPRITVAVRQVLSELGL